jgi:hypothetical protein
MPDLTPSIWDGIAVHGRMPFAADRWLTETVISQILVSLNTWAFAGQKRKLHDPNIARGPNEAGFKFVGARARARATAPKSPPRRSGRSSNRGSPSQCGCDWFW